MHNLVSFNARTIEASAATVLAATSGSFYAKGIFTTISIHDREPFVWEKHWKRLEIDSRKVGIAQAELSENTIRKALVELIETNVVRNGRARITIFDESPTALWNFQSERRTSFLITTADFQSIAENFTLTTSPHLINSTSPLAGVKSTNYLEKIIAKDEAKQRGFDEAIQFNERGEVASACMSNIFWLKDRKMFTPSLETGCLAGTTREFVLENIECEEVKRGIQDLETADTIFLSSAGLGVVQVAEFQGRTLQRRDHLVMKLLPRS